MLRFSCGLESGERIYNFTRARGPPWGPPAPGAWGPGAGARAHTSHDYAYGAAYLRVRPGEIGGIKYILYVTHAPTRARRAPPMPRPGRGRA